MRFKREEPISGLEKVLECGEFERRGADAGSKHILAICRNQDTEELKRRIWASQLQILFPIIEMKRTEIVTLLHDDIENCLSSHKVTQYGEVILDPVEVEFGTLVYMMAKIDDNGNRLLDVADRTLRDKIHFLRDCRNDLAHGSACRVDQVKELLG